MAPHLKAFREQYPRVELEIMITGHPVDVIRDQIDLAVVVGELHDSELIAKPLYKGELVWVASPDYAAAHACRGGPAELLRHIQVCEKRYARSRFPVRAGGQRRLIDLRKNIIHINAPVMVREAVVNGCGVSFLPRQYCRREIAEGILTEVFQQIRFELSASALYAMYPSRRLLSNRTRAFLDFLVRVCDAL